MFKGKELENKLEKYVQYVEQFLFLSKQSDFDKIRKVVLHA